MYVSFLLNFIAFYKKEISVCFIQVNHNAAEVFRHCFEFICPYVVVIQNVADVHRGKTVLNEDMIVAVVIEIEQLIVLACMFCFPIQTM